MIRINTVRARGVTMQPEKPFGDSTLQAETMFLLTAIVLAVITIVIVVTSIFLA